MAGEPQRVGRPLRFELEGPHSAHRGDLRIVYRMADEARTLSIEIIAHRSEVYRPS